MMRSRVGLYVLGLLCLHSSVFVQETVEVEPGVLIFCDDPSVEKAVSSAVHKFNERISSGYKLALFQILTASKSENGAGSVYSLQFTTRRSDCPFGSSKPWTDCDYLATGHRSPISCNATVHMTETETNTKQVDCLLDHVIPEKASCLGCPVEIDETSEDIKVPLAVSISKYNSISDSTHLFTLHSVGHATRQVVAGLRFTLRFDMKKTTCAKADHKDLNELCVPDEQTEEFTNCLSTVDVAPWRLEPPEAHLECEPGPLPSLFTRRRPPGWSPLRNFQYTSLAPSTAPVKESSEEDGTVPKSSPEVASASRAADTVNNNPFHCPSKPWKPFHPVSPAVTAAPTKATTAVPSPKPTQHQQDGDGAFSNADLLA
ncbi:kininogen-1 [Mastacembelus armatus]|nr:kininogen-1-like [Mastacembelus armatus]